MSYRRTDYAFTNRMGAKTEEIFTRTEKMVGEQCKKLGEREWNLDRQIQKNIRITLKMEIIPNNIRKEALKEIYQFGGQKPQERALRRFYYALE